MRARLAIFSALLGLIPAAPAAAVPPFARRYGMSCTTCHVGGPPKLSLFGEAFRDNGYRIPGETPSFLREPAIPLGSTRAKRPWWQGVWPGELPAALPLGVSGLVGVSATLPKEGQGDKALQARAQATLLLGGSLGEHLSAFGVFSAGTDGVTLDQLFFVGRSLLQRFLGESALNVKAGRMRIDLFPQQPRLFRSALLPLPLELAVGREGFSLGAPAEAIEAWGLLAGRLKWVVGIANGSKPLNDFESRRDFLGRLSVKLGGNRLDLKDSRAADGDATATLGAFTYIGVGVPETTPPEPRFRSEIYRLGLDARLRARGLDVQSLVTLGQDSDPDGLGVAVRHVAWMLQIEHPIHTWLQPLVRWEEARFDSAGHPDRRRIVLGAQAFLRANVRLRVEGAVGLTTAEPHVALGDLFLAL